MLDWLLPELNRGFMPHGHCYLWSPAILWVQVLTNLAIGLAYVAISLTLAWLVFRVRDVPFKRVYLAFGIFIITCGMTHFLDVWVIWNPDYYVDGGVRLVTAVASVGTAILLPPLVPQAEALARGAKAAHDRGMKLEAVVHDLERLYERATELDDLKTRFFANVSHELRTPLALILGPVERLAGREDLPPEVREELDVARRNAQLLLRHVNDLLDVAKLEAGEVELRWTAIDLASLVRTTAAHFDGVAREREIRWKIETPRTLRAEADPGRMRRVVLNLLSNAFKFTPDGGTVRLTLRVHDGRAVIEVADSGPGIPAEHRETVFERFRQLDGGSTRRFGGTGLGLPIVRDFAELHRGAVEADDAPEGGALLRVEIPLEAPEHAEVRAPTEDAAEPEAVAGALAEFEAPASALAPAPAGRPVALVVEDNADMRAFVGRILGEDYRVETAADGREGVARAIELVPDVIVTDVMMPELSGEELLREVRSRRELDEVPVLVLTARTDDVQRVDLLQSGAQDWLAKPFLADELRVRVSHLVQVKRVREVLQSELSTRTGDLEVLARELAARKRELEDALEEMRVARDFAIRASEVKTSFLRVVSHELRTPLNALGLQSELLRRTPPDSPKHQEILERQRRTLLSMNQMVEALLQKVRLEAAAVHVELETFDPAVLVEEVVREQEVVAESRGLRLEMELRAVAPLRSDRQLLRVVLVNLIGNALKFTQEGEVRVEMDMEGGEHRLVVRDTGTGIPIEDRERVFEPFEQGEPSRRKHVPGLGLGLSLVRDLVRTLGGTVSLDADPTGGSVFTVRLPSMPEGG